MKESRSMELSALAAYTADYAPRIQDRAKQLDLIHQFFMTADDKPRTLGKLLPGRLTWFKKYAATTMTSDDVTTLAAFIERLADNEALIAEEIQAYKKRHQLADEITFTDFVTTFDANGMPIKSIISNVLRNAARRRTVAAQKMK